MGTGTCGKASRNFWRTEGGRDTLRKLPETSCSTGRPAQAASLNFPFLSAFRTRLFFCDTDFTCSVAALALAIQNRPASIAGRAGLFHLDGYGAGAMTDRATGRFRNATPGTGHRKVASAFAAGPGKRHRIGKSSGNMTAITDIFTAVRTMHAFRHEFSPVLPCLFFSVPHQ